MKTGENRENTENLDLLEPNKRPLMSKSEYAAHRGVSPSAVTRAIREERVMLVKVNGREFIDQRASDAIWDGITRPRIDAPGPNAPPPPPDDDAPSIGDELKQARLRRENAAAHMLEIDLDARCGLLVERAVIEYLIRDLAEAVRQKLEASPAILAPAITASSDEADIRRAISDHMSETLNQLAEHFVRQADHHLPKIRDPADAHAS